MLVWVPFMWPNRALGTIMVPKIFNFKKFASQAFYRHVASIHRASWTKINENSNSRIFSFQVILQLHIHIFQKWSMDLCDTAIESLRCKLLKNKNSEYHYGTQRAIKSHGGEPCNHLKPVCISIMMDVFIYFGYHDSTQKYFYLKKWHLNFPNLHEELFCLF